MPDHLTDKIPQRVGQAALAILRPLARLFVAHGVTFNTAEEILKRAFYEAGNREIERAGIKANMSRISLSTGLHRRDVKRLSEEIAAETDDPGSAKSARSLASEIYMRWSTDPQLDFGQRPLPLRASKDQSGFDRLARDISNDAHPRSLLEELKRLGLVTVDKQKEEVSLKPGGFVPLLEQTELLGLLGENVSAHIDTAVCNLIDDSDKRLEQSICDDLLTPGAIADLDKLSRDIWAKASKKLIPAMTDAERVSSKAQVTGHHVRIGMYMYASDPEHRASDKTEHSDRSEANGDRGIKITRGKKDAKSKQEKNRPA